MTFFVLWAANVVNDLDVQTAELRSLKGKLGDQLRAHALAVLSDGQEVSLDVRHIHRDERDICSSDVAIEIRVDDGRRDLETAPGSGVHAGIREICGQTAEQLDRLKELIGPALRNHLPASLSVRLTIFATESRHVMLS